MVIYGYVFITLGIDIHITVNHN